MAVKYISGEFIGTGAALSIKGEKVGFKPDKVKLTNTDDLITLEWNDSMANASGWKKINAGGAGDPTDLSLVTANGITPLASGFTIGTDSVNASGKRCLYEAWG